MKYMIEIDSDNMEHHLLVSQMLIRAGIDFSSRMTSTVPPVTVEEIQELLKPVPARAFNDPTVDCCGRDAADCYCLKPC